jgi:flagellar M-ring protein FliF
VSETELGSTTQPGSTTQLAPAFDRPVPAGGPSVGAKDRILAFLAGYTPRQRAIGGAAVVAVVVAMMALVRIGGDQYATLYSGVSPEDGGAIVAELEKLGVPHRIGPGGDSVQVPAGRVHETRMKLSGSELPSRSKVGYGVLDNQGLTTSEFGQRVGFQRAMEGELARTIESLDAVDTAVVHLALPEQQVFASDDRTASASVLIRSGAGRRLDEDQVRAVVNLVASGIEGLSPESVTVADSDGNVLSAPGQGIVGASGGGSRQRQTAEFEAGVRQSLQDLMAGIVGKDGATVTVAAVLDFDENSVSRETFEQPVAGADGSPLRTEESTRSETYTGSSPAPGGVLGPDAPVVTGGDTDYELEEADVRYAVNRVVESTNRAPGRIERLSVAVAVDETRVDAARAEALAPLLSAGAGIDAERGDVLTVTRTAFEGDTAEREAARAELEAAEAAREAAESASRTRSLAMAAAVAVAVAFILLARRRRRRGRDEESLSMLPAIVTAPAVVAAAAMDAADSVELDSGERTDNTPGSPAIAAHDLPSLDVPTPEDRLLMTRQSAVAELIEHQPDEVASLLRSWLGDRRSARR